jgi:hypothetical protein
MKAKSEYWLHEPTKELYSVLIADGVLVGGYGPIPWSEALKHKPEDFSESDALPFPTDEFAQWKFRKSGKFWHDQIGYCTRADMIAMLEPGRRCSYVEVSGGILEIDYDTTTSKIVAKRVD